MVKSVINGTYEIVLPKHRADRPEWYTPEGWEKKRLDSMYALLKKGDVVFYIGAEEGEMAALCALWGAEVVLVEPNPKVWPNIKAIWEANKLPKPLACFAGFASNVTDLKPAKLDFDATEKNGWPVVADGEVIGDHGFRELYQQADATPQIQIDGITELRKPPTAIILDVEGSEWRVLEGAEKTIKKCKPLIWLSGHPEFMFHQYGEYLNDLRKWIKDFGYTETLLDYKHEVHLLYKPVKK